MLLIAGCPEIQGTLVSVLFRVIAQQCIVLVNTTTVLAIWCVCVAKARASGHVTPVPRDDK